MRWNLIWYAPLVLICLLLTFLGGVLGYQWMRRLIEHWWWAVLLSPSAYIWLSASVAAILAPLRAAATIPIFFAIDSTEYRRRYLWTLFSISLMALTLFGSIAVAWGSFPLDSDKDGFVHLRLIPFIPLPSNRPF